MGLNIFVRTCLTESRRLKELSIDLKTSLDAKHIRRAADIVIDVIHDVRRLFVPGNTTASIANEVGELLSNRGAGVALNTPARIASLLGRPYPVTLSSPHVISEIG